MAQFYWMLPLLKQVFWQWYVLYSKHQEMNRSLKIWASTMDGEEEPTHSSGKDELADVGLWKWERGGL